MCAPPHFVKAQGLIFWLLFGCFIVVLEPEVTIFDERVVLRVGSDYEPEDTMHLQGQSSKIKTQTTPKSKLMAV